MEWTDIRLTVACIDCLDSKVIELGNTKGCIRQHDRMY